MLRTEEAPDPLSRLLLNLLVFLVLLVPDVESETQAEILCSIALHERFYPSIPALVSTPWATVIRAGEAWLPTVREILIPILLLDAPDLPLF